MIKVSVIVPIYNVEPYIERCLKSLVNQTLKDIEIILIDDCSTDKSLKIAREYASKDNRIKLIELTENQGAAVARNKGLEIAQGEYLGFVDPDDDIDLNFYEELYKETGRKKRDIVKCQIINISEDGVRTIGTLNNAITKYESLYYFTYEWQSAIYRAALIFDNNIKFPPKIIKAQDVVFLNEAILKAKTYKIINNVNYYYYKRADGLDARKISIDKIKSALLASEYILNSLSMAYNDGTLNEKDYIRLYCMKLLVIPNRIMYQNDSQESKILCMNKFFELFHQCKIHEKLKQSFPLIYKDLIDYSKTDDTENLIKFLINSENAENYMLYKMRNRVKKDMNYV